MIQDLIRDVYKQILLTVETHDISKGHEKEVAAYVSFLAFSILGEQAANFVPFSPDEFMYHRFRLYAGLTRSELINNWNCPDIPDMMDNRLIIAFIAFGDLLINDQARKDYRSAPLVVHDFTDTTLFGMSMLKQVLPLTDRYVDRLIAIREYADSTTKKTTSSKQIFHDHEDEQKAKMPAERNQHNSKADLRNAIIGLLSFVAAILLIAYFIVRGSSTSVPPSKKTGNPYANNQLYEMLDGMKMPSGTATPRPANVYNGRKFIVPGYKAVCPFAVNAGSDGDYYIYLKYQKAPTYSQEGRKILSSATAPYENDIAFIVKARQSVEIDVPIGVYKLYYATGDTFYNTNILFGDSTKCYESDELLTFSASGDYYNGHTVTLYEVANGNLDTDKIPDKSFPTR